MFPRKKRERKRKTNQKEMRIKIEIAPEDVVGVKFVQQSYDFDCDPTKPISAKEIAKIASDLKLDASAGERTLQSKEGKWYLDEDRKFAQPPKEGEVFLIRINPGLRSRQFIDSLDEDSPVLKEILFKVSLSWFFVFFFKFSFFKISPPILLPFSLYHR